MTNSTLSGYHSAAARGQTSTLKRLLQLLTPEERLVRVNAPNAFGFRPLHAAVFHSHFGTTDLLLKMGALVNSRADRQRWTCALHLAALQGSLRITKLLLAAGADPFLMDYEGLTPLAIAEGENYKQVIAVLKSAMENTRDTYGRGLPRWPQGLKATWSDEWWRVRQVHWELEDQDNLEKESGIEIPIVLDHYSDGGSPAPNLLALNQQRQQLSCPHRLYRVNSQPLTSCEYDRAQARAHRIKTRY